MDMYYFIGIIMALDEMFKRLNINKKLLPIINIVLGIAMAFMIEPTWTMAVMRGLEIGLIASGLYSAGKNIVEYLKV